MKKDKNKLNSDGQKLIISSDLDNLRKVEKFSQKICRQFGLNDEQCDNMAIALTELAINAIVHGNKENKRKKVTFHATCKDNCIEVSILDQGAGFEPDNLPNPTDPKNIWKEHGRGIFLVQNLIDEVKFQKTTGGMKILLTKYLQKKNTNNS